MQPTQKLSLQDVEFDLLKDSCPTDRFSCRFGEIDKWFRNQARKDHDKSRVRVTTAHFVNNPHPIGFYALSLKVERISREERRKFHWNQSYDEFASIYLYYVAVLASQQRKGLGRLLIYDALKRSSKVGKNIGLPGVTLNAAGQEVASFYRKLGFVQFGGTDETPRMFMPLKLFGDLTEQTA